jgi:hypothetical protein
MPRRLRGRAFACACAASMMLLGGCGYMVGSGFREEVRSVHVPIFTSDASRRGLEYQLTEAVHKQIQNRSHYRLAKPPYADTELKGRIVDVRKTVLGETKQDDPRELQLTYAVEVTWVDLRNGKVLAEQRVPITPDLVHLLTTSSFAPEIGQSMATGNQSAVQQMARRIVDSMEAPW